MKLNRRELLKASLVLSGTALLDRNYLLHGYGAVPFAPFDLPDPQSSGIEHVVVVTMENRSFDHFFGWLPNANGKQSGLTFLDPSGVGHSTYPLSGDYTGCPHPDPDHSYSGGRIEYDGGTMDGFLLDSSNDVFSIGYYGEQDIPFLASLARSYTTCDNYFVSILGPTLPNRLFLHAAQTDRLDDSVTFSSLPTIWDSLAAAGVSANYYYSNIPFLALWGAKYLGITKSYDDFLSAAKNGTLPAVSYVDPSFTTIDDGLGNDDHPHADIRRGDRFLHGTYEAVANGPAWPSTVFIVTFDEWGGFFDHVPPPRATAANSVDPDVVNGKTLLGFRVGTVIASPFTRGMENSPFVNHTVFDHTSILKLIEWVWGLTALTPRDASNDVGNLASALNFAQPVVSLPTLPTSSVPFFPEPCFATLFGGIFSTDGTTTGKREPATKKWRELRKQAAAHGFAVK
jgi:phospholipase C